MQDAIRDKADIPINIGKPLRAAFLKSSLLLYILSIVSFIIKLFDIQSVGKVYKYAIIMKRESRTTNFCKTILV